MDWASVIQQYSSMRVLVVGDICLDRWCRYSPKLGDISRETGIPRIGIVKTEVSPGAGGTVAANLAALGAGRVAVLGAIGQDGFAFELERALANRKIDYRLLVASPEIQTFTYTKLLNDETGIEDKPRVDFVNTQPLPGVVEDQAIANFHGHYTEFDIIIVSDQAETDAGGVITPAFREVLAEVSSRHPEKIVLVDSRNRIELFRNVIAKPNAQEADEACERLFRARSYPRLRETIGRFPLLVTRGEQGTLLVDGDSETLISSYFVSDPVDTCGAGDSFAAGFALALRASADYPAAARFGNLVSSVTIMKAGTGAATAQEVLAAADAATTQP